MFNFGKQSGIDARGYKYKYYELLSKYNKQTHNIRLINQDNIKLQALNAAQKIKIASLTALKAAQTLVIADLSDQIKDQEQVISGLNETIIKLKAELANRTAVSMAPIYLTATYSKKN